MTRILSPREAYEAIYGQPAAPVDPTAYRPGICPDHGAVAIDVHARCSLCGQEAHVPGGGRAAQQARAVHIDNVHDKALAEDSTRLVVQTEVVAAREVLAFRPRRARRVS